MLFQPKDIYHAEYRHQDPNKNQIMGEVARLSVDRQTYDDAVCDRQTTAQKKIIHDFWRHLPKDLRDEWKKDGIEIDFVDLTMSLVQYGKRAKWWNPISWL